MEHEQVEKVVAQKSAWIYLPISIGSAVLFWLGEGGAADLAGNPSARISRGVDREHAAGAAALEFLWR
jgi:hypothetical protein